ncbi:MAG: protein-glutamate O-methyltransferase CheR [Actinobacteria bacterium]|nr:protein-glutamate O-methyltransferase CheR [Actinomycetota bacterium]
MTAGRSTAMVDAAKLVAAYVSERSGLNLGGMRESQLMSGISRAMRRAGATSADGYRRLLQAEPAEFERLVGALTVGESYFFRDPAQVGLLRDHLLPERAAARGGGRLRVWSAGCATGQEAYTLAMVAEEAGLHGRVSILATDLSRHALSVAQAGVYREWSLRGVSAARRAAYFHAVRDRFQVDERFVAPVAFRQHNLVEPMDESRDMDVVVCRNVLVYLLPEAIHRAGRQLASALAPGGWLLTAPGDPPLDVEELEVVRTPAGYAYRRTATGRRHREAPPAPPGLPQPDRGPRPAPPPAEKQEVARGLDDLERARVALERGDYPAAARLARSLIEAGEGGSAALAVLVRALASAGDLDRALEEAESAVAAFPVEAELRLLQALVLMEAGQPEQAAEAARAAVYLDGRLALAHLVLGQAEASRDNTVAARRSLRNAGALLQAMPEDAAVPLAGGETAGRLAVMAAAQERCVIDRAAGGGPVRKSERQR